VKSKSLSESFVEKSPGEAMKGKVKSENGSEKSSTGIGFGDT
jgi:hypothetical protein